MLNQRNNQQINHRVLKLLHNVAQAHAGLEIPKFPQHPRAQDGGAHWQAIESWFASQFEN